jgi:hypothetical protein
VVGHDNKSNLFISRVEDEEEFKMLDTSSKQDFDVITEVESQLSHSTRESTFEVIQELYLGEPKWHKSSSWVKPMPHRVYKIRTVWCHMNRLDTEVHRRYSHFLWLQKLLIKEFES